MEVYIHMNTDFTVLFGNIGNFVRDVLKSSITSNVVAIISLVITFQTMKSAKEIKKEMKEMQITALEKNRFAQNKPRILKNLQTYQKSLIGAGKLSKDFCREVMRLVIEIEGYKELFNDGDFQTIEIIHEKIKTIINKDGKYDNTDVNDCIELIGKLKNILNKGEYSL